MSPSGDRSGGALARGGLSLLVLMAALVLQSGDVRAARILGIFPTPSISHQLPFQAIMKALAARGHEITVISTDPLKEPVANYTDVDFSFSYPTFRSSIEFASMVDSSGVALMKAFATIFPKYVEEQLNSTQFQDFLKKISNEKFDLVFLEWIAYQAYFGLVHAVGSPPLIGVLSLGGMTNAYNAIGNPNNPAVNPELLHKYSDRMTFWQRLHNTYVNLWMTYFWKYEIMPTQEALMRKYFGDAPPPVAETEKNMSLFIMNNHWTTDYPRALLPNVIQLTGTHVKDDPGPLPKELQQWMDEADAGVIYFSLGSNVMSKDLPSDKRSAILNVFRRLKQRVFWKWEENELPGRPDNVRISKWLPQQSILAHRNVRLFVTQGGLQSFQEALFHSVPFLVIPFMGDQHYNAEKMVSANVGRRLELADLTEESFLHEIQVMLRDKSYKENARRLSAVFREHKATSLESALWWIEYVLRHNGAHHLRAGSLHLEWYQYLLLDVVAAVLAALLAGMYLARVLLRFVCGGARNQRPHSATKAAVNGGADKKNE